MKVLWTFLNPNLGRGSCVLQGEFFVTHDFCLDLGIPPRYDKFSVEKLNYAA